MSKNQTRKEYESEWREKNREKMRAYSKKHYQKNKDKLSEKHAEHYQQNKDKYAWRAKRNNLDKKYSITLEEFDRILVSQNHTCKICEIKFTAHIRPCVDHCHTTKIVRGLLCRICNLRLQVVENKEFTEKAIKYLDESMK
jgi:hypothetical protein